MIFKAGLAAAFSPLTASTFFVAGCQRRKAQPSSEEALYYKKLKNLIVQCTLCPNNCVIAEGERSPCLVRENYQGKLFTLAFGNPCAVHVDPVEKKPLFHVLPGEKAFSLATAGCNFHCKNCQNWQISQFPPEETQNLDYPPPKIVEGAKAMHCPIIAYTYSEPVIFYEYMLKTAEMAFEEKIINMMHSNGFINPQPLLSLIPYLQAANIDLKGMSPQFYDEICDGELTPVLKTLELLKENGVMVEITNLVIPSYNDSSTEIEKLVKWVHRNLGPDTPLHFSRFYPTYRLTNLYPTPIETLEKAREIALENGIFFAYIGNVPGHPGENTYCPDCQQVLIKRRGYTIEENNLKDGRCPDCQFQIPGIWRKPSENDPS